MTREMEDLVRRGKDNTVEMAKRVDEEVGMEVEIEGTYPLLLSRKNARCVDKREILEDWRRALRALHLV